MSLVGMRRECDEAKGPPQQWLHIEIPDPLPSPMVDVAVYISNTKDPSHIVTALSLSAGSSATQLTLVWPVASVDARRVSHRSLEHLHSCELRVELTVRFPVCCRRRLSILTVNLILPRPSGAAPTSLPQLRSPLNHNLCRSRSRRSARGLRVGP